MPTCSGCGAAIKADVQGGLCLACLLSFGLKDDGGLPADAHAEPIPVAADFNSGEFAGYHILGKIGEGGCGVVYRAEQLEPIHREVAIKAIKLGMDTRNVMARFEVERQSLAMMDHPGIAKVFDAGITNTGRPFFVMELVRGESITNYCNHHRLTIGQRLELFIEVCHAVQHAHQKGIIHRDIKPSNILITDQDGRARPKVIDFGIAKAMARQRLGNDTIYTAFDQFIGTPAYMSPEQAGLTGEDVDTRSDIYSLGVLLYEMLTDRPPFDPKTLRRAALNELLRIICEKEPARPSTQLATLDEASLTEIARHRSIIPARLLRELRGDLDWIVMQALEKDRSRRYETANGLSEDIRRFLTHEPVAARSSGAAYRTRKFIRRHRFGVAAATITGLAVICGLVLSLWMFVKEQAARQRAVLAEQQQEILRHEAEAQVYAADMNNAARTAIWYGSLTSVANLISPWRQRLPDLRGWEWYYLNGICHPKGMVMGDQTNDLKEVTWSPDGLSLAVVDGSPDVTLWNPLSGTKLTSWHSQHGVLSAVAWRPDGQQLAVAGAGGMIEIWNAATGSETNFPGDSTASIYAIAWSPDGKLLASSSGGGMIKIRDAASGAILQSLPAQGEMWRLAWHPDSRRLASVGERDIVQIWDARLGREVQHSNASGYANTLDWSPDGRLLAMGGNVSHVRLWDVASNTITGEFSAHGAVAVLKWSLDGQQIATTGRDDGVVKIWDVSSGKCVHYFRGHLLAVHSLSWNPEGNQIASASADGTVRVWDLNHDNDTGSSLKIFPQVDQIMSVAWHPDGHRLASASSDGTIRVWSTLVDTMPKLLGKHDGWAWKVAWNPTGTQLASAGGDGVLKLWAAAEGRELWSVSVTTNAIRGLAWSPDGQQIAVICSGSTVAILNPAGQIIHHFTHQPSSSMALAWSPDGRHLAIEGSNHSIQLLDAVTGAEWRTLSHHRDDLRCLVWSPDGSRLASCGNDGQAKIWDVQTGVELHNLSGHSGAVYAVAWSPDGNRLATGSWDRIVKIWNPSTGQLLCSLEEQLTEFTTLDWSPDGSQLACSGLAGKILIYDSRPGFENRSSQ